MLQTTFKLILLSLFIYSCSNDSEFSATNDQKSEKVSKANNPKDDEQTVSTKGDPTDDTEKIIDQPDPDPVNLGEEELTELFTVNLNADSSTNEVRSNGKLLIVLDNSVSMKKYLAGVYQGFEVLAAEGVAKSSQIAVTNSMLATAATGTENLKTGTGFRRYKGIDLEPGFQRLVGKNAIEKYRKQSELESKFSDRFSLKGCSKWFSPDQKNDDGKTCIRAHTQIAASGVGCEPLLHAYQQFVNRYKDTFSGYSRLDVLFVSDEKAPGCGNDAYKTPPTLSQLMADTKKNSANLTTIKMHGILNLNNDVFGQAAKLVKEAKGQLLSITANASEYKNIIGKILTAAAKTRSDYVHDQKIPGTEILSITMNGEPYTGEYTFSDGVISIKDLPTGEELSFEVKYK